MPTTKQKVQINFYREVLRDAIPAQSGTPLTEEEVSKMSLDELEEEFFSKALSGDLPTS